MKKAQLFAEPFIIIFALLVAILLLAWGVKIILDIQDKGSYTELLTTITDLKEQVTTYYNLEQGSRSLLELRVPNKITCFCFKDLDLPDYSLNSNSIPDFCNQERTELINIMKNSQLKYNLFVTPVKTFSLTRFKLIEPTTILRPTDNPLCIKVENGIFKAIIENKGDHIEIKEVTP